MHSNARTKTQTAPLKDGGNSLRQNRIQQKTLGSYTKLFNSHGGFLAHGMQYHRGIILEN